MINPIAVNQADFDTTDIICNGESSGKFTVEFTGGNPPYQYSLNGGAYQGAEQVFQLKLLP